MKNELRKKMEGMICEFKEGHENPTTEEMEKFEEKLLSMNPDGYDGLMDPECIPLCNALNTIKGIKTIESCCGHGEQPFMVWFTLEKEFFENLHVVSRVMDRNYGGFVNVEYSDETWGLGKGWRCQTSCNDTKMSGKLVFEINSGEFMGEKAYGQANRIAENIYWHLAHNNYCNGFGIKR